MKRSLYHTYQMNLGTSCLLNRTIPKNLSTKWGALQMILNILEFVYSFFPGPGLINPRGLAATNLVK